VSLQLQKSYQQFVKSYWQFLHELATILGMAERGEGEHVELLMPPADEQRAIICSLESNTDDESLYVYTVSQSWYDRWRAYVGLDQTVQPSAEADSSETSQPTTRSHNVTTHDSEALPTSAETNSAPAAAPGPIEMDLTDEDNISVDEKVIKCIHINDVIVIIILIRELCAALCVQLAASICYLFVQSCTHHARF